MHSKYSCLYKFYETFGRDTFFFLSSYIILKYIYFVFIVSNISHSGVQSNNSFSGRYLLFCINVCTY
jgi:hypothetical protein